jgi:hypothetical protein
MLILIRNDRSSNISISIFLPPAQEEMTAQVAVAAAVATVDHSDIRGSKPHNRDPSGAASD